jgi:hypothetical protein
VYNNHLASAGPLLAGALLIGTSSTYAFDVNEQFSIGGIIAAAGQCQDVSALLPSEDYGQPIDGTDPVVFNSDLDKFDNQCRGGLPIAIELDYHPTERDQFFVALGWAAQNGLNET